MDLVESYNITELSAKENTPYNRIHRDRDLYIPIKILTAQSRATKRGYTIRYVKATDVKQYLEDNNNVKRYSKKSLD